MAEKLWEEVKKGIKETVTYVTEKTEELTAIGRLKVDIASVKRKIEKKFSELGKLVYGKLEQAEAESLTTDEAVNTLVQEINRLERELKEKEEELEEIGKKEKETETKAETAVQPPPEKPESESESEPEEK